MMILNLYAGIGGNRKLWGDEHDITAVENQEHVADVYKYFYPNDTVVVGDAHQYLLDHYKEFDFIWSSPPCPTHGRLTLNSQGFVRYPDMQLYQEIIFLKQWFRGQWCVENVIPYYEVLITPTTLIDRHLFWTNFSVPVIKVPRNLDASRAEWPELAAHFGVEFPDFVQRKHKRLMLRNIADPTVGLHILNSSQKQIVQEALI